MSQNKNSSTATRRKFLTSAAVAGAAVAAPNVVSAQGPIAMTLWLPNYLYGN